MAERKIPSNMQPWKANINGKEYEYPSGITTEVPEEVAALIDGLENSEGKPDPRASQRGIEKDVTQIVKDNFAGGVGYEETSEVVLLPETSFEVIKDAGSIGATISGAFPYEFEVGKEYTVTFDGVTNTYTAILFGGGVGAITDTSLEELVNGNGYACMGFNNVLNLLSNNSSLLGTHTIKISDVTTTTHKIGSKYIDSGSLGLEPLILYAKQM